MMYVIKKTNYSRGAWRVVHAETGDEIGHTDYWQDADGKWQASVEPICGETKAECVKLVLKLLWNAGKRITAMREEQTAARPREG